MTRSQTTLRSFFSNLSFQRIITSNRFIPEVDGFRFIAILIVILSHVIAQCGPIPINGPAEQAFYTTVFDGPRGVFLFFTISGFILALPFARHHLQDGNKVNLLSYFRRRITRLEPPYVIAMLVRTPLVYLAKRTAIGLLLLHLLASLFYVHSLVFDYYSTINPPAWSLEIEIQFYILAPFLTAIFLIRSKAVRRAVLVGIILAAGMLADTMITHGSRADLSLLGYFHYFMAGFLLCDFYLSGDSLPLPAWLWDVLGIAALAWMLITQAAWFHIAFPFAALVLYMAGFHGRIVRGFFRLRPISIIGGMCYSIYLTHTAVLTAVAPLIHRIAHSSLPEPLHYPLIFGLPVVAAIAVGTVYFLLIERPCMDPAWPHKLAVRLGWSRKTALQPTP